MKQKTIIFYLVMLFQLFVLSCESKLDSTSSNIGYTGKAYKYDELVKDFKKFSNIIENKTEGLYTDRNKIKQIIEPMTEIEFFRLLATILAELHCGHSFLSVSLETEKMMREEALFFPLRVRIISQKLFVIEDPYSIGIEPGSEIVAINGRPSSEVLGVILGNLPTDGADTGRPRYEAERWFAALYYSYIDSSEFFHLTVRLPNNTNIENVIIPGVRDESLAKTSMGIVYDTINEPASAIVKDNYAMLKIPVFSKKANKNYNEFLRYFFYSLPDDHDFPLILDLRGNYGGSPEPTVELFKYLIINPVPFFSKETPFYLYKWKKNIPVSKGAFRGRLFVLIDEAGFSMNSFLISLLKFHNIGTLIGAQTSGSYKCSDAARMVTLANTGLRFVYSTETFSTAVTDQESGIGIEPEIKIEWSLDDYLLNRDPVLRRAFQEAGIYAEQ